MSKMYRHLHLSVVNRTVILVANSDGQSMRSIARMLGRLPSTISREFKRHETSMRRQ
jgi:IS30 family transposase